MSDANKYTGRLAGHYVDLERFVQAIYESTQPFAELRSAAETLPLEFDIDTAVGVQLDAVGERVGVSRKLKTPLEGVYFAFDEDEVGFDEGVWKDDYDPSEGMVSLDDEFYRLVIKAKIAANSWDGTNDTLDDVLSIVFNEKIGTYASANDNQDMTMTIGLSGQTPDADPAGTLDQGVSGRQTGRRSYRLLHYGNRRRAAFRIRRGKRIFRRFRRRRLG